MPTNPPSQQVETAQPKLRDPLEIINSSSRVKLKADPTPDMGEIFAVAKSALRHHPTLALTTWKSSIARIRVALENMEDIYDDAQ